MSEEIKKRKGFAALSPERRKEIARQGGKKAQETGRAHRWTSDEAREAGRKGGKSTQQTRRDTTFPFVAG